jgi:hypothetical protein
LSIVVDDQQPETVVDSLDIEANKLKQQLPEMAASLPDSADTVIIDGTNESPFKAKKGVPVWFKGKVSPAFEKHIFWPSPPKKKNKTVIDKKQLFPACASSELWRRLYREKASKNKSTVDKGSATAKVPLKKQAVKKIKKSIDGAPDEPNPGKSVIDVMDRQKTNTERTLIKKYSNNNSTIVSKQKRTKNLPNSVIGKRNKKLNGDNSSSTEMAMPSSSQELNAELNPAYYCGQCSGYFFDDDDDPWAQCTRCQIWFHDDDCFIAHRMSCK